MTAGGRMVLSETQCLHVIVIPPLVIVIHPLVVVIHPLVIAGLDPVIPADFGDCGGARIKSGQDDGEKVFLRPRLTDTYRA
jgi:hypothetical protein